MTFGGVVGPVFGACIPVITKLVLRCTATEPPEPHIHHFAPARNNSFIGNPRCCGFISLDRTFRLGPTHVDVGLAVGNHCSLAVMNRAASSNSKANAMTNLVIWAIERMALLKRG